MAGVSSISLTNVGKLYTSVPTITLSAPTAPYGDSAKAEATLTFVDGALTTINIIDSGAYYTESPAVNVENIVYKLTNLQDSDAKWGTYSYEFSKDNNVDSELTNFTNIFDSGDGLTSAVKLEFWLYAEDSQNGPILKFTDIPNSDSSGVNNSIGLHGNKIEWRYTDKALYTNDSNGDPIPLPPGVKTLLTDSDLSSLNYGEWNFIEVLKESYFVFPVSYTRGKIYINNVLATTNSAIDNTQLNSNMAAPFVKESITLANSSSIQNVKIDAIRFINDNNPLGFIPDSDRSTTNYINYAGFEPRAPMLLTPATITNNRVSEVLITDSGDRVISANVVFDAPTGTPSDFTAQATAEIDSAAGTITSISITDSGDFYLSAPTVTISAATNPKQFIVGETVNQTLSSGVVMQGEVAKWSDSDSKLHLIHIGGDDGKYHSFATTTGATPVITGLTSNASGVITAITEDNQIASNEQNDNFDTIGLDFLDFTETNPFGDPN